MNYLAYQSSDLLNGNGLRSTLFVSGCSHGCVGCYNVDSWNPKEGQLFTEEHENNIIADLNDPKINRQGLSLSGGDPLYKRNRRQILQLVKRVKSECANKDIWLWTGFTKEECLADSLMSEIISYVDVLVDGKFEQDKYDPNLKWKGSSNQNVIFMSKI